MIQLPLFCPTCGQGWDAVMCPKRMEPCGLEPYVVHSSDNCSLTKED